MGLPAVIPALRHALSSVRSDVAAARERDPAARSMAEVLLCYPGLHALWMHRVAHTLWTHGIHLPARVLSQISRFATGIEIHPGARIGPGLFIDHGMGVVIGETTEIGEDVTIYQGVTLGGTGKESGKRHPTVRDRVIVGTGARVLGPLEIGEGAKVGAGSIVIRDVPANSTVVGNPGRTVVRDGQKVAPGRPDIEHTRLPDPMAEAMVRMAGRIGELEGELAALREGRTPGEPCSEAEAAAEARRKAEQDDLMALLGLNGGAGI
ncbi:MAG: serine O-acetyltransferase [Miltoncostaeaceae bacterium]